MWFRWICVVTSVTLVAASYVERPHIVFIVADDLGWDDVSCHGSNQILTPNIDMLAYQGVALHQYYTDCEGTPSRSAMFTGKYPMRLGTQGPSIRAFEDRGIPVKESLLPDYLKELGYATHLVGKWGVGKSRSHYHPCHRGFNHFYGFLGDVVDYYTYNTIEKCDSSTFYGMDLFNNFDPVENQSGHLTHILTNRAVQVIRNHNASVPLYLHMSHAAAHTGGAITDLQPPADSISENDHIAHPLRRLYAGQVTSLDKSIGNIVGALAEKNMLHNTIIVFTSDNGAPSVGSSQNYGSNYPFRGDKGTPWEGAVRSIGIIWHAQVPAKIYDRLFHVTDWLPTLVTAAGGTVKNKIDGINQWGNIIDDGERIERTEMLISIDETKGWAAIRERDFKMIVGDINRNTSGHYGLNLKQQKRQPPFYDTVLFESETSHVFKETLGLKLEANLANIKRDDFNISRLHGKPKDTFFCIPTKAKGCLFNVSADPLETHDLWHTLPEVVRHLTLRLRTLWTDLSPRSQPSCDLRADPALRNYVWSPWIENNEIKLEPFLMVPPFPLQVSVAEIQFVVDLNLKHFKDKVNSFIKNMGETIVKSVSGLFSV